MEKKIRNILLVGLAVIFVAVTAVAGASESTAATETSVLSIDNFGRTTTYEDMPQRVIVLSYNSAEILSALGVADKIIALQESNNSIDDVLEEYRDDLKDVPKPETINIQGGVPTLENILSMEPDLIVTNSYYFNVPTFGTVEDYESQGVNLYITEGSYISNCTIENTYNDIRNLGEIFGTGERAESLISAMREKVSAVRRAVEDQEPVKVFVFDSESNGMPATVGGGGLGNDLVSIAGAENIFSDIETQFGTGTWEQVIEKDPEYIIILKYGAENDAEDKIKLLKGMPELSAVRAVAEDHFIVVPLFSVFPGIQNALAVETIAEGIHPDAF